MNFLKIFFKKKQNKLKEKGYNFASSNLLSTTMSIKELIAIISINKDFDSSDEFDIGIQNAIDDYIKLKNNLTNNEKLKELIIHWKKELTNLKKEAIYPEFYNLEAWIDDLKKL